MKQESIIAITSFPGKGQIHDDQVIGIASYAKNALRALNKNRKDPKLHVNVLAEELAGERDYKEGRINVKRLWKRNSPFTIPKLIIEIFKNYKDTKNVLIQFELSMFGTLPFLLPFPLLLIALKLLGKKTVLIMHQVVPDMDEVTPHINLSEESLKTDFINVSLRILYGIVLLFSSKLIVFEEDLKEKLAEFGSAKKIVVIPHGVESFKNIPTKNKAREKLGIKRNSFVILSFGFLAWYKGTDWLVHSIETIKKTNKISHGEIQLVLAGGPNPNHEKKEYYRRYIKNIMKASQENGFMVTGFVPEKKIPLYFKACDLVVLPYRTFMSSSGPLSIAFSFKKPFLLSPKLRGILTSDDLKNILSDLNIREKDILFQNFNTDFEKKLIRLKRSIHLRKKLEKLSTELGKARAWDKIGRMYYDAIVN